MKRKRSAKIVILITGIALIGLASYLYYEKETIGSKTKQITSNTATEEDAVTEAREATTTEVINSIKDESSTEEINHEASTTTEKKQNKKLPSNYEWDEKQWGEPPQIIYDFAENQEKFDFIVNEVNSLLSDGEGFTTRRNNVKLYSESENGEQLKKDIDYLLNSTKFYKLTKKESGYWIVEYDQEEDRHIYIYTMRYAPEMTEEEAWDNGYMRVVGDWYFVTIWKI